MIFPSHGHFGRASPRGTTKTPWHTTCIGATRCVIPEGVEQVCHRIIYMACLSRHSLWHDKIMLPRWHDKKLYLTKIYIFHTNSDEDDLRSSF